MTVDVSHSSLSAHVPHGANWTRRAITLLFAILGLLAPARAADWTPERQRQALQEALDRFDAAVGEFRQHPEQSQRDFRQAAAAFEALVAAGVHNAALEFNLGNTYFRLGDTGRAIVHYLRARRLAPRDAATNANLDYARERVEPVLAPAAAEQFLTRLLFWHYTMSLRFRWLWAIFGSLAGWGLLAAWLRWRGGGLLTFAIIGIALGVSNGLSVLVQLHEDATHPSAVIITGPQTLRSGRGDGYEPVLKQTLGAGVECQIRNERADWAEVELRDGHSGWVPMSALERI